jgi:hypothetical protein
MRRFLATTCLILTCTLGIAWVTVPTSTPVYADDCSSGSSIPQPDCRGQVSQKTVGTSFSDTANSFITTILDYVFRFLAAAAVIMLIYAGIQYMLSNGNADAVKKSRQNIQNVVLGIIILTAAYAIINLIIRIAQYFLPT